MLPVMLVTIIAGPQRKFVKSLKGYDKSFHKLNTTRMMNDSERYGLALPMIKAICQVGDIHNAIGEDWMEVFCKRNFGSSFEGLLLE